MKAEDFFRLSLEQLFDIDKSEIDKYFKEFKRNFCKLQIVLDSLKSEVKDRNGEVLDKQVIYQDIEQQKNNVQKLSPELLNSFFYWMYSWFDLFLHEIELQLNYAKVSYDEYLMQKNNKILDSKKVFRTIHHFSIHIANISKLIDKVKTPTNSLKAQLLSPIVDKIDLDLVPLRSIRNHLEHFEERLDAWHYLNWGKPILDMNVFNGSTKGLNVNECLRVLDFDNDKIYILGEEFDLNLLFSSYVQSDFRKKYKILQKKRDIHLKTWYLKM